MLNFFGSEIYLVNAKQYWFKHYLAGHILQSVGALGIFFKKKIKRRTQPLKNTFNRPFNDLQKQKSF